MKWSWKLGSIAGIDIRIHTTFLLLLFWIGLLAYQHHHNLFSALEGILFTTAIFVTVVLHELSHALTARLFGIQTKNILLLPIGGIAQMEKIPEKPWEGLLVSLAGPAVNFLLAGIIFVFLLITGSSIQPQSSLFVEGSFWTRFMWVNISIAVFNLLPAYPMDGGRALRSFLAFWLSPLQATQIAATLGQLMAVAFFFLGLFFSPLLMLIALFIGMGASTEASMAKFKAETEGLTVGQAMVTHFETLSPNDTLAKASEHILAGFQQDFPVLDNGRLLGFLTQGDLLKALSQGNQSSLVREAMGKEPPTAQASEALNEVFTRLQASSARSIPVLEGSKIVGILTLENIAELLMIRTARHQSHHHTNL